MPSNSECFSDQSAVNYYKAFIHFLRIKCDTYADRVFVRYYSNKAYETITYAEFDRMTTNLACKWIKEENLSGVVSYIGDHCVDYLITMVAIMKTRLTLFVISTRNSEAAIVSLLEKTQPKIFFTTPKYKTMIENANTKACGAKVTVINPFDINAMLKEPLNPRYDEILDMHFSEEDLNQAALIIHSSGSTDFPKPIYVSNRYLINVCGVLSVYKEQNPHVDVIDKDDVILSTGPLFHLAGLFNVCNGAVVGASCVYLERLPASQTDIDFALRYNKCTALVATPIILEEMIPYLEEKKDLSAIQRLKYIISGGAPLKREVGDWFQDHSVHICSLYGSTEMGVSMLANLDPQSKNWYSVRSIYSGHNEKRYIAFEEEGDGLKHLYVTADCPHLAIDVINRPDGGYNSNDLFEEDPDNPGYYIHRGRRDDILLMENGEKTNPVPMENTIRQSPMVKQVAVLGSGRQCTLALISIDTEYAMDYSPEEMISMVHKAVRKANEECPSHSTILPKMVKILPLSKPLPTTDKGNVMRKRAEMIYKDIVEKTYKEFLEGSVDEPKDGSSWSNEQIESFLVRNSADVLNLPEPSVYHHQGSLFDLGLNSLTAIQLRNIIANHFRDVPRNFLFQYSTLASMKEALISKKQEDAAVLVEKRYQQTQALAQSYIDRAAKDFPVAENKYRTEEKESVVLLTGATGSLGAFILRDLLKNPQVKKVYCLVRGKEAELYDRLIKSFKSRHLDTSLLNPERVEALPMRLNEPYLGLTKEHYEQLKGEVTIVQHCAWLLDFNMTIEHYDRECISSFYTLLKFAYRQANPMHVHFISSVSASAALASEIEERPLPFDSHSAMPMGYAQSKFVCEILLNYLIRQKNFPCYVERVGQISGDSENGVWNTSEQYPMLFVSGGALMRKMPKLSTDIDWIPVDYASAAIVDIMLRTAHLKADEESSIYHIVNPQTKSWSDVIDTMRSCGMEFDLVDTTEWIEALSKDHSLPAFRLLAFYEDSFKSGFRMPYYQTKKTCEMAPVLGQSPMIDSELFKKYLHHWQSVGFYSLSN